MNLCSCEGISPNLSAHTPISPSWCLGNWTREKLSLFSTHMVCDGNGSRWKNNLLQDSVGIIRSVWRYSLGPAEKWMLPACVRYCTSLDIGLKFYWWVSKRRRFLTVIEVILYEFEVQETRALNGTSVWQSKLSSWKTPQSWVGRWIENLDGAKVLDALAKQGFLCCRVRYRYHIE